MDFLIMHEGGLHILSILMLLPLAGGFVSVCAVPRQSQAGNQH